MEISSEISQQVLGNKKNTRKRASNTNELMLPKTPYCPACSSESNQEVTGALKTEGSAIRHSTLCEKSPNFNPTLLESTLYGIKIVDCKSCYRDYAKNLRTMSHAMGCKRRKGNNSGTTTQEKMNNDARGNNAINLSNDAIDDANQALFGLLSLSKSSSSLQNDFSYESTHKEVSNNDVDSINSNDSRMDSSNITKVITPTTEIKILSQRDNSKSNSSDSSTQSSTSMASTVAYDDVILHNLMNQLNQHDDKNVTLNHSDMNSLYNHWILIQNSQNEIRDIMIRNLQKCNSNGNAN